MAKAKSEERFIRKNVTLPAEYRERMDRLKLQFGAASDSELIRQALVRLEEPLGLQLPESLKNGKKLLKHDLG